jgi:hypothetical protein
VPAPFCDEACDDRACFRGLKQPTPFYSQQPHGRRLSIGEERPRSAIRRIVALPILFRRVVVKTIGGMVLQLLGLNMFAVHAALVGVLGFIPIGKNHIVADLVFWKIGKGAGSRPFAMRCRSKVPFVSIRHVDLH